MLLISHGIIVVVFVILCTVFLTGKGSFLFAGYNTASKAEEEKIYEKLIMQIHGGTDVFICCSFSRHNSK